MKVCLKINIPARYLKVPNNMFPVSKSLDCEFHGNLEAAAAAFQLYFHTTPPPTQLPRETSTVWHLELLNFYINIFRKLLSYDMASSWWNLQLQAAGESLFTIHDYVCYTISQARQELSQVTNIENIEIPNSAQGLYCL